MILRGGLLQEMCRSSLSRFFFNKCTYISFQKSCVIIFIICCKLYCLQITTLFYVYMRFYEWNMNGTLMEHGVERSRRSYLVPHIHIFSINSKIKILGNIQLKSSYIQKQRSMQQRCSKFKKHYQRQEKFLSVKTLYQKASLKTFPTVKPLLIPKSRPKRRKTKSLDKSAAQWNPVLNTQHLSVNPEASRPKTRPRKSSSIRVTTSERAS